MLSADRLSWEETRVERPLGPGWVLTYTIHGQAVYRDAPSTSFRAVAGDLVLLRGGAVSGRALECEQRWDAFWLRFEPWREWRPDGFTRVADGLYRTHITRPGHRQRLHDAWECIISDLRMRETARVLRAVTTKPAAQHARDEAIKSEMLLLRLREILLLVTLDCSFAAHLDPRIRDALDIIEQDLDQPLDIHRLAAQTGLSYSWFAHLFKSQIGVGPKRVQLNVRLRRAAAHLTYTDDTVGAIASRTGFSTIFEFSRAFRREYDESPTAYRARHR